MQVPRPSFDIGGPGDWTTKATMTTGRMQLASGVVSGILYAVGGYNGSYLAVNEAYNPATNTWTTKASMPTVRASPGAGVVSGILYTVGGSTTGSTVVAVNEAYDPVANTWTTKASMPTARYALGAGVVNGILYAVGGGAPTALATVEAYNPATNTWTTKASMPTARAGLTVGVVSGILYAVGGVAGGTTLATVEAYNPATNTWTTKASMPTARQFLAGDVVNGILYAVGGNPGGASVATVEAYDPVTNTWTTKASMPTARSSLATSAVNGFLYAIGGSGILQTNEAYQQSSTCGNTGSGVCYYVDAALGNDANVGDSLHPFLTLQKAGNLVNPGDGVRVRDGTYTGAAGSDILAVSRSGTAANWIVFRAMHQYGAIVDGQTNTASRGIHVSGNYIIVDGFEVKGEKDTGVELYAGNSLVAVNGNIDVINNNIHDIGRLCDDGTGSHSGVTAYAYNLTIERNKIHNIGRFGPGEDPNCSPTTTNWQGRDHGIYHAVGDSLVVRNNLFYTNVHGWSYHRFSSGGATASGVYILNNTFSGTNPNKLGQAIIAGITNRLVFANNIFYQPYNNAIWFDATDGGTWPGGVVENTISTNAITNSGVTGLTLVANLANTNPLLVSPSTFDFHLQTGSPGIDSGVTLTLVTVDFDGTLRPQGASYDRGAYER